ncbi:MAG: methyltransferase domain-containing protein [Opitutales bacterium]|nr:methyltransferase domain-containing protein [Opitutales bacterium]
MPRQHIKRETDLQIISEWIERGARVFDAGCGRGILLEHLANTRGSYGLGVDIDASKVASCVKRGVNVYQGDALRLLAEFGDNSFDWVILSRTLDEVGRPADILDESLRVGRRVAVGFVNHGYWLNRWSLLFTGVRTCNEVFPSPWEEAVPSNPVSVAAFEAYCRRASVRIDAVAHLRGDWRRPCRWWPALRAGYAVYSVSRG